MKKRTFLAGALIGGVVSGAVALLYAPQSGEKTRRQLQYKGEKALYDASEFAKEKADEIVAKAREVIKK